MTRRVLRVTATMATEVASRERVHLDSILMARHRDSGAHLQRSTPISQAAFPHIPVVALPYEGHGKVHLCSSWILPNTSKPGLERIVKRKDPIDIEERVKPYNPSSGPEKAYCLPLPTAVTPTVSWLVVGRRRSILQILRNAKQIGSVRRHGYGMVLDWKADAIDDDPLSSVIDSDGMARRFLPASWMRDAESVEIGPVSPPYWHPEMRVRRVRPGVRCDLLPEIVDSIRGSIQWG